MTNLEKVKKNGRALYYVKNQTTEICLAAVKENGCALEFVKKQTEEICLAAFEQNEKSIKYISPDLIVKAFRSLIKSKIKIGNFEKCSRFEIMDLE